MDRCRGCSVSQRPATPHGAKIRSDIRGSRGRRDGATSIGRQTGRDRPRHTLQSRTWSLQMDNPEIIRHPLDRFSLTENMSNLNESGRDAVDTLMTMIGDMRFMKDTIRGFCARYFLLIDTSWFPQLCLSAQINSAMFRVYLWGIQCGEESELENVAKAVQSTFHFPENEGKSSAINEPSFDTLFASPCTDHPQSVTTSVGPERPIHKPPLMRIGTPLLESARSNRDQTK
jgi:hypothetical protein